MDVIAERAKNCKQTLKKGRLINIQVSSTARNYGAAMARPPVAPLSDGHLRNPRTLTCLLDLNAQVNRVYAISLPCISSSGHP